MNRHRVITIRNDIVEQWFVPKGRAGRACHQCNDASTWLSLTEATEVTGYRPAALCQLADSGELHSATTNEGHLLICATSISAFQLRQQEDGLKETHSTASSNIDDDKRETVTQ